MKVVNVKKDSIKLLSDTSIGSYNWSWASRASWTVKVTIGGATYASTGAIPSIYQLKMEIGGYYVKNCNYYWLKDVYSGSNYWLVVPGTGRVNFAGEQALGVAVYTTVSLSN